MDYTDPRADDLAMSLDIKKSFGRRIRALREKQGLTQEDLANRAKLHRNYIGGIERGERNPSLVNIVKLSVALRIPIDDLFSRLQGGR